MTDQLDGAGRPLGTPSLADAIAQRDALQSMILASAAAPLDALLARLEAAELGDIAAAMHTVLPLLPEGHNKMALAAAAGVLSNTPGMVRELLKVAKAASA